MDWQIISYVFVPLFVGVLVYAYRADQKHTEYRLNELAKKVAKIEE